MYTQFQEKVLIRHTYCDGLFALSAGFVFTKRIIFLANLIGCTICRISFQESSNSALPSIKLSKMDKPNKNPQLGRNAYPPNFHRTPKEFVVSHSNIHQDLPRRVVLDSYHILGISTSYNITKCFVEDTIQGDNGVTATTSHPAQ